MKSLDAWLDGVKWSVIHFNFGLHDLKYRTLDGKYDLQKGKKVATPEQYAKNLDELVRRLRASGVRLIFATPLYLPQRMAASRVPRKKTTPPPLP